MRHARTEDLDRLDALLASLRDLGLREPKRGTFYVRSRACVHFHADGEALFADVRTDPDVGFVRVPVTTKSQQAKLVADVRRALRSGLGTGGS